jgi:hypothetical protein
MPRQRHETRLEAPITSVFSALIDVAARGRWGAARIVLDAPQPRPGCEYAQQRRTVLRRGKVLECLRPVKLTLEETLLDRPCRVQLRLKWRVEPLETSSCVLLEASYALNGAASLRPQIAAAQRALSVAPPERAAMPMHEQWFIPSARARRN